MHPGAVFVIGYGSDLRGDDAAGQRAARVIASWRLPRVEVRAVHQLAPELAVPLASADRVIFLDAHAAADAPALRVRRISPAAPAAPPLGHASEPQALLALTARAYGRAPEAWWITIPALDFSFGAELSPVAAQGVADALEAVGPLLAQRPFPGEAKRTESSAAPHLPRGRESVAGDGAETQRRDAGCPTR